MHRSLICYKIRSRSGWPLVALAQRDVQALPRKSGIPTHAA